MATSPEDTDRNVRRVVQVLMTMAEVEASDVAAYLGVGRSSLYERLSGKRRFTVAEVSKLAKFFDVDPGVFFTDPRALLRQRVTIGDTGRLLSSRAA
jgi:antitoxin component HigA of HigAB toxin-antitoxin module